MLADTACSGTSSRSLSELASACLLCSLPRKPRVLLSQELNKAQVRSRFTCYSIQDSTFSSRARVPRNGEIAFERSRNNMKGVIRTLQQILLLFRRHWRTSPSLIMQTSSLKSAVRCRLSGTSEADSPSFLLDAHKSIRVLQSSQDQEYDILRGCSDRAGASGKRES